MTCWFVTFSILVLGLSPTPVSSFGCQFAANRNNWVPIVRSCHNCRSLPAPANVKVNPLQSARIPKCCCCCSTSTRTTALSAVVEIASSNDGKNDDSHEKKKEMFAARRVSVGAVLAASFLNLLGFTMAGPITPALGKHFGLKVGITFGSLTSMYPLGMLFGLFMWPSLSDRIGRKPIIMASLLGSGLGLAAQAWVIQCNGSLKLFLATRVLTGCFAGSSPVSKAYLADVGYKDGKLPRYLALRDASSTMAFIVGPLLGGVIFDLRRTLLGGAGPIAKAAKTAENIQTSGSLAFVIGVSATASAIAGCLVGFFVKEINLAQSNKDYKPKVDIDDTTTNSSYADEEIIECPLGRRLWTGVGSVCLVSFLFNIGDSTYHAFFSQLLKQNVGFDARSIGFMYALLACVSFTVSATTSSRALKTYGPVATCVTGMTFVAAGLLGLGMAAAGFTSSMTPKLLFVITAAVIYYIGVPLYGPTIPTMLLRCVPSYRRGFVMGLDGAVNTVARVLSPLLMGGIYSRYGAGAAYGWAGAAVFSGAVITLARRLTTIWRRQQNNAVIS